MTEETGLSQAIAACSGSQLRARMETWAAGDSADLELYIAERETRGDDGGAEAAKGWLAELGGAPEPKEPTEDAE